MVHGIMLYKSKVENFGAPFPKLEKFKLNG
jgi:hypothetical protein